jgi:hypothetical protein
MSEVLGDADANDELIDDDEDDSEEFDDLDDLDPSLSASGWAATLTSPVALAITALVLATVSLIGLLSSYLLVNAIVLAHPATNDNGIFGQRISAVVALGLALLAVLFAVLAHSAARPDADRPSGRIARVLAGAAVLIAIISIAESGGSLLIMLGAHPVSSISGG